MDKTKLDEETKQWLKEQEEERHYQYRLERVKYKLDRKMEKLKKDMKELGF